MVGASLALAGCARRVEPPAPPPTIPARPSPGYESRLDSLDVLDTSVLGGKRIVLDPGHGGTYRGALGVGGLTEAAVNLAVATELRALLVQAGAEVLLTRETDRDFLAPADSTLRYDLEARVQFARQFRPDVFLSVHHNADPGGAHDRNEIQTYYKLGDEGPSLDLAMSLHRFLRRNLGIRTQRILPGNYYVLRNSEAPAVLSEASYITNPDVEARLALAEKRRLEAEALFLGLAHYFLRRRPEITSFSTFESAGTPAARSAGPGIEARVRGVFDWMELRLDGAPIVPWRSGERIRWEPDRAIAPGAHTAALRVALSGEGSAREQFLDFEVRRPIHRIEILTEPETIPVSGGWVAVRARLLDEHGWPIPDSARVRFEIPVPRAMPAETTVISRQGEAWAYVRFPPASKSARAGDGRATVRVGSGGVREIATLARARTDAGPRGGFLHDARGRRLADTLFARVARGGRPWLTRDGFVRFDLDESGKAQVPRIPGYRQVSSDDSAASLPLVWSAVASGALHGRKVTLDPDGGGNDTLGMGPSGTRAALYNLALARALRDLLVSAGADVRLTRTGDYEASEIERVRVSENFGADRFLRIAHRAEPPRLGFYFSSPAGKAWAQRTAEELQRAGLPAPPAVEDAQYPLQQTSCPALYVSPLRVDDPAHEERLNAPGTLRAEAYALFLSLAREWAPEAVWATDSLEVRGADGTPLERVPVLIGGLWLLETDALGRIRFARTEPGPIEVQVEEPRIRVRRLLLDSDRGVVLTGPGAG